MRLGRGALSARVGGAHPTRSGAGVEAEPARLIPEMPVNPNVDGLGIDGIVPQLQPHNAHNRKSPIGGRLRGHILPKWAVQLNRLAGWQALNQGFDSHGLANRQ